MKQTIEVPDIELHAKAPYVNDRIRIYDKGKSLLFIIAIDGAGNEWLIEKDLLRRLIKC